MLPTSAVVKETAKTVLKGNMFRAVSASSVVVFSALTVNYAVGLAAYALPEFAAAMLSYAMTLFLTLPLILGLVRFFRRMQWGVCDDVVSVFHFFSSKEQYRRAMKLLIPITVKIVVCATVFSLPVIALSTLANPDLYEALAFSMPRWADDLSTGISFMRGISLVLVLIYSIRFYLAPFLYVADEEMDYAEAIYLSRVISKRTRLEFVYLFFSLALWIALSVLLMPLIFTIPFFIMCYLVHCRFAVAQYNATISKMF